MSLSAGGRFGHYEILSRIGAGGMGEVYRARDDRLHRTVALKLVRDGGEAASGSRDRERLIDEARAASALNHPNICTVYEVGEAGGRAYIAMEYVEGRPLSESVPHDGLPIETVVRYGAQIAAGLAHAHAAGVIHRDLKTANVVITPQGTAKVLDFGLARRVQVATPDSATRPIDPGVLGGTLAYVPPEVLLGAVSDARSDIWALGVVLYEMATGDLPFKGRTEFDLTAAILRTPPLPFPPQVQPMLRSIVARCLAKEPGQRYQQAGEVRAALEAIESDLTSRPVTMATSGRRRMAATILVLAALAALAAWWVVRSRRGSMWERTRGSGRLTRIVSTDDRTSDPALSPDGRMITYVMTTPDGRVDLYAGRVRGGARVRLTNDDAREASPKFSPDGERIAYTTRGAVDGVPEIRTVPALGGEIVSAISHAAWPTWSPDGGRLAYIRAGERGSELTLSSPDGSNANVILRTDSVYPFLRNPSWSPDGASIAVVRGTGGIAGEIWIVPSAGGDPRRAIDEPASVFSDWPVFAADGSGIVHSSNRGGATNVWFLPLSGRPPVRLTTGPGPDESPTVAADGTIAFVNSRWRNTLDVHDLAGGAGRTLHTHAPFMWSPAVSPDGRQVAFTQGEVDGTWHVWVISIDGGNARRLTSTDAGEIYPRWAPDGASVFFNTWSLPRRIGRVPSGGGTATLLSFGADSTGAFADISPDGRHVVFSRADAGGERVYVAPADGGAAHPLVTTSATAPRWSPDGSLVAFAANRGYDGGIFVVRADGSGVKRLTNEGGWPVWWPDGRQVGYLAVGARGDQELRVIALDGGAPRTLAIPLVGTNHPFAVAPDGRTIVTTNAAHVSDEIWILNP